MSLIPYRTQFIYDHLKAVSELIEEGIPVERYYHWSLMDNFELLEGESGPFGLFAVNFETQERTLRKNVVNFTVKSATTTASLSP